METSFYSWIRKGLAGQISEVDNLGNELGETKNRPTVQLTTVIKATPIDKDAAKLTSEAKGEGAARSEDVTRTEAKTISLSGPGDVLSLNSNAILRVFPTPDSSAFPTNEFPYVEFWEPDFAWRFTPAKAAESGAKLRPWLTLVVCKASECSIEKTSWGVDLVTFNVENDTDYEKIMPPPTTVWQMAHAQSKNGQDAEICRILGVKKNRMEERTDYKAFLIPVFEIGRLRGLRGPNYDEKSDKSANSLSNIPVQRTAWEAKLADQMNCHERPLTFPSYYSWNFKTGSLNFSEKVRTLTRNDSNKPGIDVDVTSLGEGLDYAVLSKAPARKKITVPAALTTVKGRDEEAYPSKSSDEAEVYKNLNNLLSKSPVFEENAKIVNSGSNSSATSSDDPWITPPIYGGKHVLATSLKEENAETPWLNQLNMDLHYRAAAGLGKKVVQRNQEELVNRAWKQIDAIKALNAQLNQKMVSANVGDSVKYLNYGWVGSTDKPITSSDESAMVASMMENLSLMKDTKFGKNAKESGTSLSDVLNAMDIPEAFASVTFQNSTKKLLAVNAGGSVLESIAKGQYHQIEGLPAVNVMAWSDKLVSFRNRLYQCLLKKLISETNLNMFFTTSKEDVQIRTLSTISSSTQLKTLTSCYLRTLDNKTHVTKLCQDVDRPLAANYVVSRKLWEISTRGYSTNVVRMSGGNAQYDSTKSLNVYALEHSVFLKIFNITDSSGYYAVKMETGANKDPWYIVDRDKVPGLQCFQYDGKTYKSSSLHPSSTNSEALFTLRQKGTNCSNTEKDLLLNDLELLPQRVILDVNKLSASRCITCYLEKTHGPFFSFYKKMSGNYGGQYLVLASQFDALEKAADGYSPTCDEVEKKSSSANHLQMVNALRSGLRDDSAYGRLKECADTYYKTFFSSKELRENYLEDCLASKYPIKAYPIFPEPTYYYLKDIADEFILPGVENLPDGSVSVFKGNAAFVESYLCGMNTEMGRELLWREYPTDQRGSYFKKFWDSETSVGDIKKENYFDVKSIHRWDKKLGDNHVVTESGSKGDLLFFAIKGDLMKLYPDTMITLRKAKCSYTKDKSLSFSIMDGVTVENKGILEPVSQAFVREDVYVVGFKISDKEAIGSFQPNGNTNSGYMLVFEKTSENVEFEIDSLADSQNSAADFAANSVVKTSLAGKHVLTLIGKN